MASESYGLIGADFSEVSSAATFKVGQCTRGDEDGEFVYVKFTAIVSGASRAVTFDKDFNCRQGTGADLASGRTVGVSLHTVPNTANQYGWVQVQGTAEAYVATAGVAGDLLGLSGSTGAFVVRTAATSANTILGATCQGVATGTTAAIEISLDNPHWNGV